MIIRSSQDAMSSLQKRMDMLKFAKTSNYNASVVRNFCRSDIFYWLEHSCFTYDPRPGSLKNIPFHPYDFQRDLITKVQQSVLNGQDLLIEKSRDMGATWCILYVFQWFWQFYPGYNFHLGSKKQDNVDKIGDISTLFGKLRYNLSLQPSFLLPGNFTLSKCSHLLKLINPANGNTITGESSNAEFSRSGRYTGILYDEFAFWEQDEAAWAAGGDSSTCRIAISTPYGSNNKFARLRHESNIDMATLHWKLHPFKTSEWYEKEKNRRTQDEIARELDINYLMSVEGRVYKDFEYAQHVSDNLTLDDTLPIIRTWDFGLNPAVIFSQIDKEGRWFVIDEFVPDVDLKPTISEFIPQVVEYCKKNYKNYNFKDICDIAGKQRSSHSGKTDIDWLISYGVVPLYNYVKLEEGINLVASRLICKSFAPDQAFLISTKCKKTIEAFMGGYKRKRATVQGLETEPEQIHPYEDVMDCIRYTAWQYFNASGTEKRPKRSRHNYSQDNPLTGY